MSMTPEGFKQQVQEASDYWLTDYFEPEIEYNFDDPDKPEAYITIRVHGLGEPYVLTLGLTEYGDLGVQAGEENYLHPDDGGFMTCLFFEAHGRISDAAKP